VSALVTETWTTRRTDILILVARQKPSGKAHARRMGGSIPGNHEMHRGVIGLPAAFVAIMWQFADRCCPKERPHGTGAVIKAAAAGRAPGPSWWKPKHSGGRGRSVRSRRSARTSTQPFLAAHEPRER
jgi:hypothetical protein